MDEAAILIVDDLPVMRKVIREALEQAGLSIAAEAENGKQALQIVQKIKPSLVILDIMMPVLDGLSTLRLLRRHYPDSQVIMCSSISDQKAVLQAILLGASDFVVKPFAPERLVFAVQRLLFGMDADRSR